MKRCENCKFCKKSMIADYIKDAEFYRCELDNDPILIPYEEGKDCTWFERIPNQRASSTLAEAIKSFFNSNT